VRPPTLLRRPLPATAPLAKAGARLPSAADSTPRSGGVRERRRLEPSRSDAHSPPLATDREGPERPEPPLATLPDHPPPPAPPERRPSCWRPLPLAPAGGAEAVDSSPALLAPCCGIVWCGGAGSGSVSYRNALCTRSEEALEPLIMSWSTRMSAGSDGCGRAGEVEEG
jgi:hypothetical protein